MSNKHKPIGEVVSAVSAALAHSGAATAAKPGMQLIASNESLTLDNIALLDSARDDFRAIVQETFNSLGMESLGFQEGTEIAQSQRDNALSAAAFVMMAAGDPAAFARAALESRYDGIPGAPLVNPTSAYGSAGSLDYRDRPALEAYDNKNLTDFLPYSITFNIYGQRQDEFSELLFKTFVVPPEQAGIEVTASRLLVYRDQNHSSSAGFDMGKRNLIQAAVDYKILQDESTRLLPVAKADNSNDAQLVDADFVATTYASLAGVSVPTRPLKIGVPVNLIGISQYQPLVGAGAQFDNQDAVDSAIRLSSIVIKVAADAPAIVMDTTRMPNSQFQRALQGNYRDMTLNWDTEGLVFDKNTKAVDGTAVTDLAAVVSGSYTVTFGLSVNGKLNTEKGNCNVSATQITVTGIYDTSNNPISLTTGAGATIVAKVQAFSVIGYTLECNRTNSNRRTRGLRLDTTLVRERYYIPLGAPLSVARPNDPWQQAAAVDLKAIVTAARLRNSNNAVTAMFNIIDALRGHGSTAIKAGEDDSASIGGLGRLLINPYFDEDELDLVAVINSTSSAQKAEDIAGVIVNKIRDKSFTMLRDSNYQPALEAQLGGPSAKPTLFVGTDQRLIRHIMVTGDDRTFTPMFDNAIVKESLDARMHDKIVLTFVRPEATEPDVLSFGAHIWSTELVSTIQVTRSGESNSIETMVQPRTLHINMMPVIAVINVTGLTEVLGSAAQYHMLSKTVA